ncbi:hypothetical protein LIER_06683 [Lithospermum erythrorhizon]|uniref:Uncharacterized protein n=1 Tax=Lithospermum erythrorhizon TaxID=34254 RepID=A0AAV3P635_LITER
MAELSETINVEANDLTMTENQTQVELIVVSIDPNTTKPNETQVVQNFEANDLTTTENKTQVELVVEAIDPNTAEPNETQAEENFESNPPRNFEKEILQHLLSLDKPEELLCKTETTEEKDMENLDYAQEFPAIMVRSVNIKIHPEPEEEFNDQAKTYDINNGMPHA